MEYLICKYESVAFPSGKFQAVNYNYGAAL